MFGLRSDGVKVKCADPIDKIVPHIMKERSDSMNNTVIEQRVESFDAWIDDVYRRTGVEFNYMHIVLEHRAAVCAPPAAQPLRHERQGVPAPRNLRLFHRQTGAERGCARSDDQDPLYRAGEHF